MYNMYRRTTSYCINCHKRRNENQQLPFGGYRALLKKKRKPFRKKKYKPAENRRAAKINEKKTRGEHYVRNERKKKKV